MKRFWNKLLVKLGLRKYQPSYFETALAAHRRLMEIRPPDTVFYAPYMPLVVSPLYSEDLNNKIKAKFEEIGFDYTEMRYKQVTPVILGRQE